MKKIILLIACAAGLLFSTTQNSFAQTTTTTADSTSAAAKASQITSLLTSKLNLSQTQASTVSGLVTTYAGKFSKTNSTANSGGLKAKLAKEEQTTLGKEFSEQLPKLLNSDQAAKYPAIKNEVSNLFTQIK